MNAKEEGSGADEEMIVRMMVPPEESSVVLHYRNKSQQGNPEDEEKPLLDEDAGTSGTNPGEAAANPPGERRGAPQRITTAVAQARIALCAAAALYSTNFSSIKLLVGEEEKLHVPVNVASLLRFGVAALITLPWLFPTSRQNLRPQVLAILYGVEIGLWDSMGYLSQAIGLTTSMASSSVFLCSLTAVVVPVLDALTGRMMKRHQIAGALLAVAGVIMLEMDGQVHRPFHLSPGELWSLLQPIFFALGFWRTEHAMARFPDQSLRLTASMFATVFIISGLVAYASNPNDVRIRVLASYITMPPVLFQIVWTGAIATALTGYMETRAMGALTAAETTIILMTEPLWGAAFAAFVLKERQGFEFVIGGLLIIAGCLTSSISKSKNETERLPQEASAFKFAFKMVPIRPVSGLKLPSVRRGLPQQTNSQPQLLRGDSLPIF